MEAVVAELNDKPLSAFKPLFATLDAPVIASLRGTYRGAIVGPPWVRAVANVGLALGGLNGWWGKRFDGLGGGVNLVQRDGAPRPTLPMRVEARVSGQDLRPAIALIYPPGSRFPWSYVVDDLRQYDENVFLGLSYANVRGIWPLALPFMLHKQAAAT